jgi:cell division protein FtsI (penicillin-binding protein 3)
VLVVVVVLLAVFGVRLVDLQAFAGRDLAQEAFAGRLRTAVIQADRGQILDRDGVVLATSVESYDIAANQVQVAEWKHNGDGAVEATALLSPLLGVPEAELGAQLVGDRPFVYLAKGVTPEVHQAVLDLRITGITAERTSERVYPAETTAGSILGFVGAEGHGMAGVEQVYEEALAGEAGSHTYERGNHGEQIPTGADQLVPAVPGRTLQLTLASDLQYMAQQACDDAVARTGAEWCTVEVQDVATGEILVLADSGSIDPNDPADASPSRAVAVTYEPGSTAKVITMAAILETGVATPTSQYVVPYRYTVPNGQTFRDSHEHADLQLTLAGILAQSSNTGTVMVGQNVPPQVRIDYLHKFGFGQRTDIGLPGETAGLVVSDVADWDNDGRSPYTILFGQSVGVTTVQATQVFATLANGGVRVQPHIVAGFSDADGAFSPAELDEPQQVVSSETAEAVVRMLEGAVTEGTGGGAAVPGYRIAGKTGTAQAFEGNGVIKVVASFIGIAPADDPRIVVNVVVYDPKTVQYGGAVAAPVFSEVTAHALRYLGVPPSATTPALYPVTFE